MLQGVNTINVPKIKIEEDHVAMKKEKHGMKITSF